MNIRLLNCLLIAILFASSAAADVAIIVESPANSSALDTNTVVFSYNASSILNLTACALKINSTIQNSTSNQVPNQISAISKSLSEGAYSWSIECTDATGTNSTRTYQ